MVSLTHGITFWDNSTFGFLFRATHIWFQFRTFHLSVTMNGIYFPIVVEEHTQVVDTSLHVMVLPRSTDILRSIALQALAVDIRKHIELSVGIADGRSPHALTVYLLMILQREGIIVEVETIETVTDIFPVHQVLRVQNHQSWHGMHRRTSQIIVVAHPQDIRVRELIIEQRIRKCSIPIISRPTLSGSGAS